MVKLKKKQTARTSKKKAMFEKVLLVDGPEFYTFIYKCKNNYNTGTVMRAALADKKGRHIPVLQTSLITVIGDL